MLYLDSSALIKHYQEERGTESLNVRLRKEAESLRSVFTSVLTYAEIHAAIARRTREKLLNHTEAAVVRDNFDADWVLGINPIELGSGVLTLVRELVKDYPLRGADAIHLASAFWLRDMTKLGVKSDQYSGPLIFGSCDKQLIKAALQSKFEVFNPEENKHL